MLYNSSKADVPEAAQNINIRHGYKKAPIKMSVNVSLITTNARKHFSVLSNSTLRLTQGGGVLAPFLFLTCLPAPFNLFPCSLLIFPVFLLPAP